MINSKNIRKSKDKREKILKESLIVCALFIEANYYALALVLKQIVVKEGNEHLNKKNIFELLNSENSIEFVILEEEYNKIEKLNNKFSKIQNLLEELTFRLFEQCDKRIGFSMLEQLGYSDKEEFGKVLKEEMIIMIKDFDMQCK